MEHPDGLYRIQWTTPNKLSYPILALGLAVGGVEWGPRLGLLGCELFFVAGIFYLAWRLRRPMEYALLASVFLFSSCYYGGFFNFLVGAFPFALWLGEIGGPPRDERALLRYLRLFLVALLLYLSHALWLAMAGLVLLVPGARRERWRTFWLGGFALLPFVLSTWVWMSELHDRRWAQPAHYWMTPWQRLSDGHTWVTFLLGGLKGSWEGILILIIAAVALFALRPGSRTRSGWDGWLAALAITLGLLAFLLPDIYGDTTLLSRRFAPWAAICALLALPPLGLRKRWCAAVILVPVLAHAFVTTRDWREFDHVEMGGFPKALAAVPDGSRLLELDFLGESPVFWIRPYFQMAAYAQLDRKVTLGYSFADTPSSLVVFRKGDWPWPWTRGLELRPERVLRSDLDHFDFVLLHVEAEYQYGMSAKIGRLAAVAGGGDWWLYRVTPWTPKSLRDNAVFEPTVGLLRP